VGVTASSDRGTSQAGHYSCSTTGNGAGVVVEDGDDVSPGKDHSELEGELCGVVGFGQLALAGGRVGLVKKEVAPLLLNAGDLVPLMTWRGRGERRSDDLGDEVLPRRVDGGQLLEPMHVPGVGIRVTSEFDWITACFTSR